MNNNSKQEEIIKNQDFITICEKCPLPSKECNGNCDRFKAEAKKLRKIKRVRNNIVT